MTLDRSAGTTTDATSRLGWVDVGKGAAVVLVVLLHVREWHYLPLGYEFTGRPVLDAFIAVAGPARMPLFFAISGYLARDAIARPWRAIWAPRVATPLYLYLVWAAILMAVYVVLPSQPSDNRTGTWQDVPLQFVVPDTSLWYFYALALYFVVAKLARRFPIAYVLGPAAVLSAVASGVDMIGFWDSVLRNMLFFLIGALVPRLLTRISQVTWVSAAAAGGVYLVTAVTALGLHGAAHDWSGVQVMAGVAAIWFGVQAAVLVSRAAWAGRALARVGRASLAVFVLHPVCLAVASFAVLHSEGWRSATMHLGAAYPLLVAAVTVVGSLALHRGLRAAGASWLFRLPGR